uniref:Putative secreted protein n=1 Tax=Anopheles darlingi TaxID=43151 RepID=A0A2M4D8L8_ANODA
MTCGKLLVCAWLLSRFTFSPFNRTTDRLLADLHFHYPIRSVDTRPGGGGRDKAMPAKRKVKTTRGSKFEGYH